MHCERPEWVRDGRGALLHAFRATWIAVASVVLMGLALPQIAMAIETATFPAPRAVEAPPEVKHLMPAADAAVHLDESTQDVFAVLDMELGKSVYLTTDSAVKRVSVGNADTLDIVVLSSREIQLVPKLVGVTNVVLWTESGRPIAAIDVEIGAAFSHLESHMRRALGEPGIEIDSAGDAIVLKGGVSSETAADEAARMALAFLGEKKKDRFVNLLRVGGHHQVMLEVVVAEMNRSVTREFGTNFAGMLTHKGESIGIQSFLGGLTQLDQEGDLLLNSVNLVAKFTGFGTLDFVQVFLDALDERGLSKILAEPSLVARSGETASFLVGGEIPIPIVQSGSFGSVTVQYKEFGIGLSFTPTVLGDDRIHLAVKPEVSEPDLTLGTEVSGTVVPAFRTRRAATAVELADGQSFAIAGLLSERVRSQVGMYPVLGQIPILGSLFRSSRFVKDETELVIIVTPRLVKPLGPGPHPLPTRNYIEPNMAEFYLFGMIEGRPPRPESEEKEGGMIGDVGYRVSPENYWSQK